MPTSKKLREQEPGEEPLAAEQRAYGKKRARLLQRYQGQFVALYQGRVVGHGPNDEDLARQMLKNSEMHRSLSKELTKNLPFMRYLRQKWCADCARLRPRL